MTVKRWTSRRRRSLVPTLLLIMAALLGVGLVTGAAAEARTGAAPPATPAGGVHTTDSKRFTITNLSGYRIRLNAASGEWEGKPADGTWVLPGEQQTFELAWTLLGDSHGIIRYYKYSDDGSWLGDYTADVYLNWKKSASSSCRATAGTCTAGGDAITVQDSPGTVVTLGGNQAQAQADALDRLCRNLSKVTCTFDVRTEQKTMVPSHVVGLTYGNYTLDDMSKQIRISETVERSQSVEVSATVSANVLKAVEASVTATYGHTWTNSVTFEETSSAVIRPNHKVWSEMVEPTLRYTGDFTLTVGNTTFRLVGVHFDVPDKNPSADRRAQLNTYTAPIPASERSLPPVSAMPPVIIGQRNA